MERIDKLLDMLSVHADIQNKSVTEQDAANTELLQIQSEIQELRTDLLQLRAEFQQLHNDLSKICMILTTPKSDRKDFAASVFGDDFEKLNESENA